MQQRPRRRPGPRGPGRAGCLLAVALALPEAQAAARGRGGGLASLRAGSHASPGDLKGKGIAADTWHQAWMASAEASEARAATSQALATAAKVEAEKAAKVAEKSAEENEERAPAAEEEQQKAQQFLQEALDWEKKANQLKKDTVTAAYDAATSNAVKEFDKLQMEGKEYFGALLADLKARLAAPVSDPKAEAAAKAAAPYFKVAIQTQAIVLSYNTKAEELIAAAQSQVSYAQKIANEAVIEQAQGMSEMALRKMIQAHGLIGDAQMKEGQAKQMRKLAESLNMSVPNYQNAATQAAIHTLATFSGLQLPPGARHKNPFADSKDAVGPQATGEAAALVQKTRLAKAAGARADEGLAALRAAISKVAV